MLTLLAATRLAWEQADAWGEPVYVVERPRPLLALSGEVRQAIQIRHMYQRATGNAVPPLTATPPCPEDSDDTTCDTMPASEVRRRIRAGQHPVLLRVASPDGRVRAIANPEAEAAGLATATPGGG